MRFRVVCGFDVTIAIFCPTSRFTSVDFPAFGRPTIATNPDRWPALLVSSASLITSPQTPIAPPQFDSASNPSIVFSDLCVLCDPVAKLLSGRTENLPFQTYNCLPSARAHRCARYFLYFHSQHFPLVRFQHFKPKSLQIKVFAWRGNFSAT